MLRVETVKKKKKRSTVERRIPHPEEVGSERVCKRILFCVTSPTSAFFLSWQPHNNKTLKILFLERQMSDMDSLSVVSLEI